MNCGNCKQPFSGRNFGVVLRGGSVVDLCSTTCRAEYRNRPPDPATPKKALGSKRKPTPSEIKRSLRPKETDVSASIASQLDGAGVWNTRVQSGSVKTATGYVRLAKPGTPDRVAAAGVPVWIEVKRSGEKPTADQLATHEKLKANGSLVFVVDDPADVPVILRGLRSFKPEIDVMSQIMREMQSSIEGEVNRERNRRNGL